MQSFGKLAPHERSTDPFQRMQRGSELLCYSDFGFPSTIS